MNLSVTSDYVKFTLVLALGAFAYARTQVEALNPGGYASIFALTPSGILSCVMLIAMVVLLYSALSAYFVISAVAGDANDKAKAASDLKRAAIDRAAWIAAGGKLDPTEKEVDVAARESSRVETVRYWTNQHLIALLIGVGIVAVCYLVTLMTPDPKKARCKMINGGTTIEFDCKATEVAALMVPSREAASSGLPRNRRTAIW